MGRHKKYPDAENTIAAFCAAVSDSYRNPSSEEVGDVSGRKKQELQTVLTKLCLMLKKRYIQEIFLGEIDGNYQS